MAKKHNSLVLDLDTEGLPMDWRSRVEDAVVHTSKLFDLYVTSVQAGVTRNPPRVLVSISREGAEEAWTERAETTMTTRITRVLELAREEQTAREAAIAELEAGLARPATRTAPKRIPAVEREREASARRALDAKRGVALAEVKTALATARLPAAAADLGRLAVARMKEGGDRWALWVQLLLAVDATAEAIGPTLEKRLKSLL